MSRRFQFSLRDLLGLLALVAVIVWATTVLSVQGAAMALFLLSPALAGALFRKPLEGCLLTAFLWGVVIFGAFAVAGILAD
ncbi:MAG TPA: hypothetical protein VHC19_02035 [Pirellulales bacterium]|nr:hypothetical protein [Pirellulales bacterium]